ncbi:hypothetical protein AA0522_2178 [Gluconacetobacter liquefaciens NRIC 0522]|nr:hypothetical protein AA0522_2178 [Gluconacetobacter liquefaciens NRIC 0522]
MLKVMNADETAEDAAFVSDIMERLAGHMAEIGLAEIVPTMVEERIAVLTMPGVDGLMARMVGWVGHAGGVCDRGDAGSGRGRSAVRSGRGAAGAAGAVDRVA